MPKSALLTFLITVRNPYIYLMLPIEKNN